MVSKLLIVIVTYKSDSYIDACLDTIYQYNDLSNSDLRIAIVDNSPLGDPMFNRVKAMYPRVSLIANPDNTGFGAANNLGASVIDSEYILFINPDTELIMPIFAGLISKFESDEKLGCVGIKQTGGGLSFFYRMEFLSTQPNIHEANRFNTYDFNKCFFSGSFMFFKRVAFEKCGKFDEKFFMYLEEPDILFRLVKSGYTHTFDGSLSFVHKVGNRSSVNPFLRKIGNRSFCYYLDKYKTDFDVTFLVQQRFRNLRKLQFKNLILMRVKNVLAVQQEIGDLKRLLKTDYKSLL